MSRGRGRALLLPLPSPSLARLVSKTPRNIESSICPKSSCSIASICGHYSAGISDRPSCLTVKTLAWSNSQNTFTFLSMPSQRNWGYVLDPV